jgi:hypothetical protein
MLLPGIHSAVGRDLSFNYFVLERWAGDRARVFHVIVQEA